ncbi:MAG: sulfotransferase [Pseudomonadota bacterium]
MNLLSIIGLPRSGTTMLGRMLSAGAGTYYHEEPNPAWRFGNRRRLGHEQFESEHATARVKAFVRAKLANESAAAIVEKTPANCLRVGFVEAIVPEARIIFLRREREAIKRSMLRKWLEWDDANAAQLSGGSALHDVKGQIGKLAYVHPSELPIYIAVGLRGRVGRILRRPPGFWGPEFAGWQALKGKPHEEVVDASITAMEAALEAGIAQCCAPHVVLRYEDIIADCEGVVAPALSHLSFEGLDPDYALISGSGTKPVGQSAS